MAIVIIDGKPAAVREMATMLRNAQISAGKGALLLLRPGTAKGQEHDLRHQVEKILVGRSYDEAKPLFGKKIADEKWDEDKKELVPVLADANDVLFKPNAMIIVPKPEEDLLPKIEALVPGFTKHFGPISRMTV